MKTYLNKFILIICFSLVLLVFVGCTEPKPNPNTEPDELPSEEDTIFDFEEIDVEVASGEFLLDGKLLLPVTDKLVPAVVIVGGSGPMDMDGTVNAQKTYRDLAEGLAKKGIASIRVNKVTFQFKEEVINRYDFTTEDEYFKSIESSIRILKENKKIDSSKLFIIGHSLGSQMIPLVLDYDKSLAGGIIMAGTTMHILDVILEQVKRQSEKLYNDYLPYVVYAKGIETVPKAEEKHVYFGAYLAYYVQYNKIDRNLIKHLECPLLIMQGELDLQVTMNHFETYKNLLGSNTNVIFKQYPLLNHLFSNGENENLNNAYMVNNPVSEDVINDIHDFIKK